jgi:hypothetical protein
MTLSRLAFVGLPGTGKTTYIGALWHMAEEPSVTDIVEKVLPANPAHVQRIAEQVRAVDELLRTGHDDDEFYEGTVEFPGHGSLTLRIHDRSGEQLQALVERRNWPSLLAGEVAEAQALVLFVCDDELILPLSLRLAEGLAQDDPARPAADALKNAPSGDDSTFGDSSPKNNGYSHHYASTAAQVVDGLENVLDAMDDRWPVRIAVVVSKFDRIDDRSPRQWLHDRLPAIEAFLDNNLNRVAWELFGVSALGGPPQSREELLKSDLHERAWAQNADGDAVPLSEPVRWALGWT